MGQEGVRETGGRQGYLYWIHYFFLLGFFLLGFAGPWSPGALGQTKQRMHYLVQTALGNSSADGVQRTPASDLLLILCAKIETPELARKRPRLFQRAAYASPSHPDQPCQAAECA